MKEAGIKVIATNRKAARDYILHDRLEAGIALRGTEIKSVRAGQVSLRESYVRVDNGEAWMMNAYIAPYDPASKFNHEPRRPRKLLLHRREIRKLYEKVRIRGFTLIPTKMYLKKGKAKVEIALAKGKRKYDKRREIAKRDAEREIARATRRRSKK
jgi:SsrA-binding protein